MQRLKFKHFIFSFCPILDDILTKTKPTSRKMGLDSQGKMKIFLKQAISWWNHEIVLFATVMPLNIFY